jgi:pyrimidine deaminase RibD-like protein
MAVGRGVEQCILTEKQPIVLCTLEVKGNEIVGAEADAEAHAVNRELISLLQ